MNQNTSPSSGQNQPTEVMQKAMAAIRQGIRKAETFLEKSEGDETATRLRDLIESIEDTLQSLGADDSTKIAKSDVDRFNDQTGEDMYAKGMYQHQKSYGSNEPATSKTDQSDVGTKENQYGKQAS